MAKRLALRIEEPNEPGHPPLDRLRRYAAEESILMNLNRRADELASAVVRDADALRVAPQRIGGAQIIDCGIDVPGGIEAGRRLAEICLAGAGDVHIVPGTIGSSQSGDLSSGSSGTAIRGPLVVVRTDQPVAACMAAQYAGWQISREGYFAMGSGPMRAAAAKEELFQHIGYVERAEAAVGVLEAGKLPTPDVCRYISQECHVPLDRLTLLAAPTSSLAGTVQVVARSVETALHKLHELAFDLRRVVSGFGSAPLPPVAADDLIGIGRTNDAVLYGGETTLWVTGDDRSLQEVGPLVPSSASNDYGSPFIEIFERYGRDFYRIDRQLFSPAVVTLVNLDTGRSFRYGRLAPEILRQSFGEQPGP